jgi:hypothetical protein
MAVSFGVKHKLSGPSEEQIQMQLMDPVKGLKAIYLPRCPDLFYLHAIPNGGYRRAAEAGRLKAGGACPGVPDLELPVGRSLVHGCAYLSLRIEMKKPGGVVSKDQLHWILGLRKLGHCVQVCWSLDAAWAVICWYLSMKWPRMPEIASLASPAVELQICGDSRCIIAQMSSGTQRGQVWFVANTPAEAQGFIDAYRGIP